MNDDLVSLQNVEKVFKTKAGPFKALRGVDLQVRAGEFVAVVGPSGSGKSTLINMITGIDRPTTGEVYVGGERLTRMSENQIAKWRGRNVGVVFQFFQLLFANIDPTAALARASIVAILAAVPARPRSRQRSAAGPAPQEQAERKVGVIPQVRCQCRLLAQAHGLNLVK